MSKKLTTSLILAVVILHGGCASSQAILPEGPPLEPPAIEMNCDDVLPEMTQVGEPEEGDADDLYYYYSRRISAGLSEFRQLINSGAAVARTSDLIIERQNCFRGVFPRSAINALYDARRHRCEIYFSCFGRDGAVDSYIITTSAMGLSYTSFA
ncbi:MAG: hypothetical protein FWE19_07855 [Oscillospiraceae bacterium]|nr:hypothetical protein [Oscillospiraceae bacterium]